MRSHRLSQRIDLDLAKLVSTTAYRLFPPQIVLQELPLKRAVLFSRVLKELGSLAHCRLNVLLTPSARLHLWANARLVSHALRLGRIALERYVLKARTACNSTTAVISASRKLPAKVSLAVKSTPASAEGVYSALVTWLQLANAQLHVAGCARLQTQWVTSLHRPATFTKTMCA